MEADKIKAGITRKSAIPQVLAYRKDGEVALIFPVDLKQLLGDERRRVARGIQAEVEWSDEPWPGVEPAGVPTPHFSAKPGAITDARDEQVMTHQGKQLLAAQEAEIAARVAARKGKHG